MRTSWRRLALALLALAVPGVLPAQTLSPAEQSGVTTAIAVLLRSEYVYDSIGNRCAAELDALTRGNGFAAPASPAAYAAAMTRRLRSCAGDEHLEVVVAPPGPPPGASPAASPSPAGAPAVPAEPAWLVALRTRNFDVPQVKRLAGNIGYLELTSFPPPEVAGATVSAAMTLLTHTDAMIIDLRRNSGGAGDMVRFLATWFFERPTAITATWRRAEARLTEDRTLPYIPGERRPSAPLYVLTSHGTFSAAEAFAFGLQQLGRAVIVGERTRGGANAGRYRDIGFGLRVFIPMANVRSPVNGKSWDRVGVVPDLPAPADSALPVAHAAALRQLLDSTSADPTRARTLGWVLEGVQAAMRGAGVDAATCAALAGQYEGGRRVDCRGSRLRYSRGGPERPLLPLGGRNFLIEGVDDARLRFARSRSGLVLHVLDADGSEECAARLPADPHASGAASLR